jgi:hypothetical protein
VNQSNRKRIEPAFIKPMRCKRWRVSRLASSGPSNSSLTDTGALRSSTATRLRSSPVTRRCSSGAFQELWRRSDRSRATSFSTESWSPWILKGTIVQTVQGATTTSIPIYFYAFDVLDENAQLLLDQPLSQRRAVLESLLAGAPEALRVSPLLQAAIGTDRRGAA